MEFGDRIVTPTYLNQKIDAFGMKLKAFIVLSLVLTSLCISQEETPTTTPEPTTTAPPTTTQPLKENLSEYNNLTPEIVKIIQNYDENGELNEKELKYAELLNKDPSLFEFAKTISDENLENLNTYWSFHTKNPNIEEHKEYMFENSDEFKVGAFMDKYDDNFSLRGLVNLRKITGKDSALNILNTLEQEEKGELILDYLTQDNKINSKDEFVTGNIDHQLFNAIFKDRSVENYEDDLVERLSENRQIERFNLKPEEKLDIYKLLYNEKDNEFYGTVYDKLFVKENSRKLISMRTNPVAFYLPGDIVRITEDGTQVYFLDLLEDTQEMRDKYYPH